MVRPGTTGRAKKVRNYSQRYNILPYAVAPFEGAPVWSRAFEVRQHPRTLSGHSEKAHPEQVYTSQRAAGSRRPPAAATQVAEKPGEGFPFRKDAAYSSWIHQ